MAGAKSDFYIEFGSNTKVFLQELDDVINKVPGKLAQLRQVLAKETTGANKIKFNIEYTGLTAFIADLKAVKKLALEIQEITTGRKRPGPAPGTGGRTPAATAEKAAATAALAKSEKEAATASTGLAAEEKKAAAGADQMAVSLDHLKQSVGLLREFFGKAKPKDPFSAAAKGVERLNTALGQPAFKLERLGGAISAEDKPATGLQQRAVQMAASLKVLGTDLQTTGTAAKLATENVVKFNDALHKVASEPIHIQVTGAVTGVHVAGGVAGGPAREAAAAAQQTQAAAAQKSNAEAAGAVVRDMKETTNLMHQAAEDAKRRAAEGINMPKNLIPEMTRLTYTAARANEAYKVTPGIPGLGVGLSHGGPTPGMVSPPRNVRAAVDPLITAGLPSTPEVGREVTRTLAQKWLHQYAMELQKQMSTSLTQAAAAVVIREPRILLTATGELDPQQRLGKGGKQLREFIKAFDQSIVDANKQMMALKAVVETVEKPTATGAENLQATIKAVLNKDKAEILKLLQPLRLMFPQLAGVFNDVAKDVQLLGKFGGDKAATESAQRAILDRVQAIARSGGTDAIKNFALTSQKVSEVLTAAEQRTAAVAKQAGSGTWASARQETFNVPTYMFKQLEKIAERWQAAEGNAKKQATELQKYEAQLEKIREETERRRIRLEREMGQTINPRGEAGWGKFFESTGAEEKTRRQYGAFSTAATAGSFKGPIGTAGVYDPKAFKQGITGVGTGVGSQADLMELFRLQELMGAGSPVEKAYAALRGKATSLAQEANKDSKKIAEAATATAKATGDAVEKVGDIIEEGAKATTKMAVDAKRLAAAGIKPGRIANILQLNEQQLRKMFEAGGKEQEIVEGYLKSLNSSIKYRAESLARDVAKAKPGAPPTAAVTKATDALQLVQQQRDLVARIVAKDITDTATATAAATAAKVTGGRTTGGGAPPTTTAGAAVPPAGTQANLPGGGPVPVNIVEVSGAGAAFFNTALKGMAVTTVAGTAAAGILHEKHGERHPAGGVDLLSQFTGKVGVAMGKSTDDLRKMVAAGGDEKKTVEEMLRSLNASISSRQNIITKAKGLGQDTALSEQALALVKAQRDMIANVLGKVTAAATQTAAQATAAAARSAVQPAPTAAAAGGTAAAAGAKAKADAERRRLQAEANKAAAEYAKQQDELAAMVPHLDIPAAPRTKAQVSADLKKKAAADLKRRQQEEQAARTELEKQQAALAAMPTGDLEQGSLRLRRQEAAAAAKAERVLQQKDRAARAKLVQEAVDTQRKHATAEAVSGLTAETSPLITERAHAAALAEQARRKREAAEKALAEHDVAASARAVAAAMKTAEAEQKASLAYEAAKVAGTGGEARRLQEAKVTAARAALKAAEDAAKPIVSGPSEQLAKAASIAAAEAAVHAAAVQANTARATKEAQVAAARKVSEDAAKALADYKAGAQATAKVTPAAGRPAGAPTPTGAPAGPLTLPKSAISGVPREALLKTEKELEALWKSGEAGKKQIQQYFDALAASLVDRREKFVAATAEGKFTGTKAKENLGQRRLDLIGYIDARQQFLRGLGVSESSIGDQIAQAAAAFKAGQKLIQPTATGQLSRKLQAAADLANSKLAGITTDKVVEAQKELAQKLGQLRGRKTLGIADQDLLAKLHVLEAELARVLQKRADELVKKSLTQVTKLLTQAGQTGEITAARVPIATRGLKPQELLNKAMAGTDKMIRLNREQIVERLAAATEGAEVAGAALKAKPGDLKIRTQLQHLTNAVDLLSRELSTRIVGIDDALGQARTKIMGERTKIAPKLSEIAKLDFAAAEKQLGSKGIQSNLFQGLQGLIREYGVNKEAAIKEVTRLVTADATELGKLRAQLQALAATPAGQAATRKQPPLPGPGQPVIEPGQPAAGGMKGMVSELVFGGDWVTRAIQTTGAMWLRGMASTLAFAVQNTFQQAFQDVMVTEQTGMRIMATLQEQAEFAAKQGGEEVGRLWGGGIATQLQDLPIVGGLFGQLFAGAEFTSVNRTMEGLRNVAIDMGQPMQQVYESAAQLAGLFPEGDTLIDATKTTQQLIAISQGALNATEAFRSLGSVATSFGLEGASGLQHIADVATKLQLILGTNIEDVLEGVSRLAPAAKLMGITFEEIGSIVATVAKFTGQTGTAASEQIGRILSQIQSAKAQTAFIGAVKTPEARESLREAFRASPGEAIKQIVSIRHEFDDTELSSIARTIGGQRQFAAASAWLKNLDSYQKALDGTSDAAGTAAERYQELLNTVKGQIDKLKVLFTALFAGLADLGAFAALALLVTAINTLGGALVKTINWINGLTRSFGLLNTAMKIFFGTLVAMMVLRKAGGIVEKIQGSAVRRRAGAAGISPGELVSGGDGRKGMPYVTLRDEAGKKAGIAYRQYFKDQAATVRSISREQTNAAQAARTAARAGGARGIPGAGAVAGAAARGVTRITAAPLYVTQAFVSGLTRGTMALVPFTSQATLAGKAASGTAIGLSALNRRLAAGATSMVGSIGGMAKGLAMFAVLDAAIMLGIKAFANWREENKKAAESEKAMKSQYFKGVDYSADSLQKAVDYTEKAAGRPMTTMEKYHLNVSSVLDAIEAEERNKKPAEIKIITEEGGEYFTTPGAVTEVPVTVGTGRAAYQTTRAKPVAKSTTKVDLAELAEADPELSKQIEENKDDVVKITDALSAGREKAAQNLKEVNEYRKSHGMKPAEPVPLESFVDPQYKSLVETMSAVDEINIKAQADIKNLRNRLQPQIDRALKAGDSKKAADLTGELSQGIKDVTDVVGTRATQIVDSANLKADQQLVVKAQLSTIITNLKNSNIVDAVSDYGEFVDILMESVDKATVAGQSLMQMDVGAINADELSALNQVLIKMEPALSEALQMVAGAGTTLEKQGAWVDYLKEVLKRKQQDVEAGIEGADEGFMRALSELNTAEKNMEQRVVESAKTAVTLLGEGGDYGAAVGEAERAVLFIRQKLEQAKPGTEAYYKLLQQDQEARKILVDAIFKQREVALQNRAAAGEDISVALADLEAEKASFGGASGAVLDKRLGKVMKGTAEGLADDLMAINGLIYTDGEWQGKLDDLMAQAMGIQTSYLGQTPDIAAAMKNLIDPLVRNIEALVIQVAQDDATLTEMMNQIRGAVSFATAYVGAGGDPADVKAIIDLAVSTVEKRVTSLTTLLNAAIVAGDMSKIEAAYADLAGAQNSLASLVDQAVGAGILSPEQAVAQTAAVVEAATQGQIRLLEAKKTELEATKDQYSDPAYQQQLAEIQGTITMLSGFEAQPGESAEHAIWRSHLAELKMLEHRALVLWADAKIKGEGDKKVADAAAALSAISSQVEALAGAAPAYSVPKPTAPTKPKEQATSTAKERADAAKAKADARKAKAKEAADQAEEIRKARQAYYDSLIHDPIAKLKAEMAETDRQISKAKKGGKDTEAEYWNLLKQKHEQEHQLADLIRDKATATNELASAYAEVRGDTITVAQIAIQNAQIALDQAIANTGTGSAETARARAGVVQAEGALRDAKLEKTLGDIDFMREFDQISVATALQMYQQLLAQTDLTEEQRRDIMRRMKGLTEEVSGQFDIGDIKMPTVYEVRRFMTSAMEGVSYLGDASTRVTQDMMSELNGMSGDLAAVNQTVGDALLGSFTNLRQTLNDLSQASMDPTTFEALLGQGVTMTNVNNNTVAININGSGLSQTQLTAVTTEALQNTIGTSVRKVD